jgi:hypothetical protein
MPEELYRGGKCHVFDTLTTDGPWLVALAALTIPNFANPDSWYIVNVSTGVFKNIGPKRSRGTNYYDAAVAEAKRRNAL